MHYRSLTRFLLGIFAALLLLAAVMIYRALPPSDMVLMAGAPTTSYADFAARYVEALRRHGVTLEIRHSGGALANLEAIRDPGNSADLALTITGLASEGDARRLYSLGGVTGAYFSPSKVGMRPNTWTPMKTWRHTLPPSLKRMTRRY